MMTKLPSPRSRWVITTAASVHSSYDESDLQGKVRKSVDLQFCRSDNIVNLAD